MWMHGENRSAGVEGPLRRGAATGIGAARVGRGQRQDRQDHAGESRPQAHPRPAVRPELRNGTRWSRFIQLAAISAPGSASGFGAQSSSMVVVIVVVFESEMA